ncbi:futalosine hydrolase [Salipaludibacillus daqingensis]|uniref:futalosine hydrolase n=1 Tax=Salipaludibacillus daqingensis TaxID=3041001 RepID=UPI002474ECB5|nr:futalosine hydrolase [Salipaludibacillus daqingensis]
MIKNNVKWNNEVRSVLVVTSVEAEKQAILKGIGDDPRFHVETIGVGPMFAAAKTAEFLHKSSYDVVVNMGVAGGFPKVARIGDAVVASKMIAADLGAESAEGFKPIEELGFGQSSFTCDEEMAMKIVDRINNNTDVRAYYGPILTRSMVTGTTKTLELLENQVPGAAAEAMEGFGVCTAAQIHNIPCYEIRTISNPVGPRDRDSWKISEALISLTGVSTILKEVF